MRILGIDPGLNATGYGVIAAKPEGVELVAAGVMRPPVRQPLGKRLVYLYDALAQVVETHRPDLAVLESLYTHHQYLTTATLMAHARGIVCLLSAQRKLPLVDYSPTRVRKALTGNGAASKEQVARIVKARLGVEDAALSSDATDALALALAHAQISRSPLGEPVSKRPRQTRGVLEALAARLETT